MSAEHLHPAIRELVRMMPHPGEVWPLDRRVVFLQALDATLCQIYGGEPMMIWLGEDNELYIVPRGKPHAAGGEAK